MHTPEKLLIALAVLAGSLAAQTATITGIVNGASAIPPGLPNYAIAPGSIFVVYGTNLGAVPPGGAPVASASMPLPVSYAGTSISVTVGGVTLPAPILYTSPTQVAGVMPSGTPAGMGTVSVTYAGNTATSQVPILTTAFGITNYRVVDGPELATVTFGTDPYEPVTFVDTAAPGDVVVIFGTGLGPAIDGIDNNYPVEENIGTAPSVFVGGVASPNVTYYGRSPLLPGLDEIVFTIPANAPQGCRVSVVVETQNFGVPIVSNSPYTSIGPADHGFCSDPVNAFLPQLLGDPNPINVIAANLVENFSFIPPPGSKTIPTKPAVTDTYLVLPTQVSAYQFLGVALYLAEPTNNQCFAGFAPTTPTALPSATLLDLGKTITFTPPSGSPIVLPSTPMGYVGQDSNGFPAGTYTVTTPGGANAGPLNFQFPIGQPVTWTNMASLMAAPIDRTQPLTITWSGGDATNGYVDIQGFGFPTTGQFAIGYHCSAAISAGSITIPTSQLLRMPPNVPSTIQVSTFSFPYNIAPQKGFDAVINFTQQQTIAPVSYK